MHITARTLLTSGIAALGVGAIALSPVQPLPDHTTPTHEKTLANLAVNLAATIDPITPWVDTFQTAGANIKILADFYMQNPFPLAKTIGANWATFAEELSNGQGNLVPEQIWNNIQTFFQAPWDPGAGVDVPYTDDPTFLAIGEYASGAIPADGSNSPDVLGLLPAQLIAGQLGSGCEADDSCTLKSLIPIVNFLNTHYSGQLIGLVGTLISPLVQAVKSFTAVGEFFQAGDVTGAINELINIPANMTNASLNGAGFLDLTGIVGSFVGSDFPISKIGVNLGGLLNAMPQNGSLANLADPPTEWAGGIGLDSAVIGGLEPGDADFAGGIPNGLLGANIGLGQFLAEKLVVEPPPAPGQAVPSASEVKAAAALVEAPPVEAPAPVESGAPIETTAAVVADVLAPEPEPMSVPAASRAQAAATGSTGDTSAAQNDSSERAPAKHRGGRGR